MSDSILNDLLNKHFRKSPAVWLDGEIIYSILGHLKH